jgi:O-antigen/teichoic acid export membrane protein
MFAEQMLRMVAGLLVGIWVARYLGPTKFGIFSYVIAFTSLFSGIAKLGMDSILVRELVNQPDYQVKYIGTAFWLKIVGALIVLALTAAILPWMSNDQTTNIYILIIIVGLFFQSFEIVDFYFQSQVLARFVSVCKIIQLTFSTIVKIYLMLTGADLVWFVWVTLLDQITLAISFAIAYRLHKSKFLPLNVFDVTIAKRLLKDSWPLILSAIMVMLYMRIDQIMIKEMLGEREVGIFSAAVRLSEVWSFIPIMVAASVFPAILNAKKTDAILYLQRLQRLHTILVWIAFSIAIPMTFLSEWLVVSLYGEAYRMAGSVLKIHIWTSVFVFLGVASSKWFISENLQTLAFWRTAYGALINIVLNLILINSYGIIGVAYATLATQIFSAYLFDLFNKKTRPLFIIKTKSFFLFR